MLLVLLILLALVAGAVGILLLHPDAGYVLINYGPWVAETTLAVLVLGVAIWFLLVYLLLKLFGVAIRLPGSVREAIDRRRQDRARESFEAGLLNLFEGNWQRAEAELVRRASGPSRHRISTTWWRRARHSARAPSDRRDHESAPGHAEAGQEHEFAILRSAGDLQRKHSEYAATKATALRLRERDPNHPFAIELLADSYQALGEWEPLRQLLAEPAARSALDPPRYEALSIRGLEAQMQAAVDAARLDQLKALWDGASAYARPTRSCAATYLHGLARLNADAEALALIGPILPREWDAHLALLYG